MDKLKLIYIYNRKGVLNKEGKALIQLRIYLGGKNYFISTGIYIAPNEWNEKEQKVKRNSNAAAYNTSLSELIYKLESAALAHSNKGKEVSIEFIKEVADGKQTANFIAFCEKELKLQDLKEASKNNHTSTFSCLKRYEKAHNISLTFADINLTFLESFEKWCKATNLAINSIARHLQVVKAYLNRAINKDLLDFKDYPFRKYKIKQTKSKREYLTTQDVQALEGINQTTLTKNEALSLNMFLFATYCGLRYSDVANFKKSDIIEKNGKSYAVVKANKTDKETPVYLWANGNKPLLILEKYISEKRENAFPYLSISTIDKHLKTVAKSVGIETNLHFHISRHTFATNLLNKGIDIVSLQQILGHSDIKTTQIYAKMQDSTIEKKLEAIFA